ncbi:hypothetical protein V1477_018795 [Vespula maculifrons]|uniref:Uncharacterized protein n=1 Tax=Vespula maculifrons TaxID=7453 RepID=A0ABD2AWE1_VESMC
MPVDLSECPSILPEREKRNPSTPESLHGPWVMQRLLHLGCVWVASGLRLGCVWVASGLRLGCVWVASNEDSTLKSTNRDAFLLRELRASQQTGDIVNIIKTYISIFRKYYRPRSHHLEVAAFGDPRANGDSTLKSTIRDAFPLRELRASQQTGDNAPPSTPSASDISRHDRSCLFRYFKEQNEVLGRTKSRDREHPRACRPSRA